MVLFLSLGLMTIAILAILVAPLLRRPPSRAPRAAYDLEVYRDQLAEVDRDRARGGLNDEEHAASRREIERRLLAAAGDDANAAPATARPGPAMAVAIAFLVPLAAGGLYLWLGAPGTETQPFASRERPAPATQPAQIEAMVAKLARRLETRPDDLKGWVMLSRSYGVLGRYDDAVAALRRALALKPGDAGLTASLGELRVMAADGMVTPAARANFEAAVAAEPSHPAARFYLGLARVQAGEPKAALDIWLALARDATPDAAWLGTVRDHIAAVAAKLGEDPDKLLAALPVPAPAPAAASPAAGQKDNATLQDDATIRSMVERLAQRLQKQPDDLDGWLKLARSYRVLGQLAKARDAMARAAALAPSDTAILGDFATAIMAAEPKGSPVPDSALSVYRALDALETDNPTTLWNLGLAEAQRGNLETARDYWRRLRDLLPKNSKERTAMDRALDRLAAEAGDG